MREIRFRAWNKKKKSMHIVTSMELYFEEVLGVMVGTASQEAIFPEDLELMQYLGIKDLKGRKVCEGDILQEIAEISPKDYQNRRGVVTYEPNIAAFMIADVTDGGYCHLNGGKWDKNRLNYTEIIGNIHENPELLK